MADVVAEQRRPKAEEGAVTDVFDASNILKFDDIGDGTTNRKHEILQEGSSKNFGEVVEEETAEVVFEKVKPNLATHSMHCPNCKSEIRRVILRRKSITGLDRVDLVGCSSCLSLFTCSENGCFSPFDVFKKRSETSANHVVRGNETIVVAPSRGRSWLGHEGVLVEILKSIVYGGLMEVIASLSVVASAAASNAVALSIVSLALANLIGGVFIIGHNIWDLRDDCYKYSSSQHTNEAATKKYNELLGQVNYFSPHVLFAILSFLVFAMVPPVVYGYSFHETNDKNFTLVMAATASLLCVLLLTMLKAYINKCTFVEYFKMVVYYIIIAVLVSGVSYVAGNLAARLMEELGWFNTSSGGDMPCLPRAIIPNLESF